MTRFPRAIRHFALFLPLVVLAPQAAAQEASQLPAPQALQIGDETPWIYEGSDVPRDPEWLFGEMDNGLRYAVRNNRVPPDQVSIRIRIDAGSLHERENEKGFAHLMEHLSFRESKHLGPGEAIPTWQRLGATFGSDTNAETSPTHTVYKLDLPNATPAALEESFRLLSGMMREPVLNQTNVATEVPIVLAEKRERGGAGYRVALNSRKTLFAGQRLADRPPIGTEETLQGATSQSMQDFHKRWYRPENTVISVAGDTDPRSLAALIEKYFGDWQGKGPHVKAPDFGDPVPPAGASGENPVGEVSVLVEPDLPRNLTYAILRPWRPVQDTVVYNEGLLRDSLAQAIINRRLESRARSGGSYLYAQVQQDDVSRSTDATFVTFAPLDENWQAALGDVRGVIADAVTSPPTQEEIDREIAEFDVAFAAQVEQRAVQAGSKLADSIIQAVDIRETVASPETILQVFRGMKDKITPEVIQRHTQKLFSGDVVRGTYVTPAANDADEAQLRLALARPATADSSARLAAQSISFEDLPPIGEPGEIVSRQPIGLFDIERVEFANGTRALLWANDAEPGRVAVKMRFGSGQRGFADDQSPYIRLGEMALVESGLGSLGQEELDRISTGRRLGFDFSIEDSVFTFTAQTREADLADQLYLFAGKLAEPRWDANPIQRAKAAHRLAYDGLATSPGGILSRDLDYVLRDRQGRFETPTPDQVAKVTPEDFRKVWEPLLQQGDVEVLVFGQFDKDDTLESLRRTIGALPPRQPIPETALKRLPQFPQGNGSPVVLNHRGDANQAAVVVSWEGGAGTEKIHESRQLEILTSLFNNRLIDEMRERAGASYAPQVGSSWPTDLSSGGTISAVAQVKPEDVPVFASMVTSIAQDLATNPVSADELARATEPLGQLVQRASTGNLFWMYQLEGAENDAERVRSVRSILRDYTITTPDAMQKLAQTYLTSREPVMVAIIPEGQDLVITLLGPVHAVSGR